MEYLVDGHQVLFSQRLANIIGIEEAILLQQLHYRLHKNGKKKEGHYWYCQTHQQWTKQHTYWNVPKIGRLFLKLEQLKLIISANKFNRFYTDRTKWYRIDYVQLQKMIDAAEAENNELLFQDNFPETPTEKKKEDQQDAVSDVIHYLNNKTNKNFNDQTPANYKLVNTIFKLGYTVEDCYRVIDEQVDCWRKDMQMQKYLRPMTLFRPVNFESYLNNAHARIAPLDYVPKPVVLDFEAGENS